MQFPTDVLEKLETVPFKKKGAPIEWHHNEFSKPPLSGFGATKRNYKASYTLKDGKVISYAILERSNREVKPKIVLQMKDICLNEADVRSRCELILRVLAKGHELRLTDIETKNAVFNKENIVFVPYSK